MDFARKILNNNSYYCFRMKKVFDISIDNIINSVLVEDMKKWVLHRKVNIRQNYNPNDKISTYRVCRFNTIK